MPRLPVIPSPAPSDFLDNPSHAGVETDAQRVVIERNRTRVYDVRDFGTAQDAIDEAGSAGGGSVLLDEGVLDAPTSGLLLDSPNVTLTGRGPQSVVRQLTNNPAIRVTADNCVVRDLTVQGDADDAKTQQYGVNFAGTNNGLAFNVNAIDMGYDGILLIEANHTRVVSCYVEGCADDGINIGGDGTALFHNSVVNCTVKNCANDQIHVSDGSQHTTIQGNTVEGGTGGIGIFMAKFVTITGNTVRGQSALGISTLSASPSSDIVVANNIIEGGTQAIRMSATSVRFAITGNVIRNPSTHGIVVSNASETVCHGVITGNTITGDYTTNGVLVSNASGLVVADNNVQGAGGAGILLTSTCNRVRVADNRIDNPGTFGIQATANTSRLGINGNTINGGTRGISCQGQTAVVTGNYIHDTGEQGIIFSTGSVVTSVVNITGNVIDGGCSGAGINLFNYAKVVVVANSIENISGTPITQGGGSTDNIVEHNRV